MDPIFVAEESSMLALGERLAQALNQSGSGSVIYLYGDLGAGKTTLTRGLLRGLGYRGSVKSPTFTLVEPYELDRKTVYHFDLYRLVDPEELEYVGIRDYFTEESVAVIEWPDKGAGVLPPPDLTITIHYRDKGREVELVGHTARAATVLAQLQ
ncbi:MAG: tRNA (adenosine(37)-N6)-threonylcarbamoyltransferase complex ATPase subunit type 1 TsaE [Gammaproteobacteria bacterium]|jgi:tRNA threonylcarbamoyladenosine biosynthesis protein TsaE